MTAILNLIYCFLMDMIQSFRDIWIVGWDSVLTPVDALVGVGGHGRAHRAHDCRTNMPGCSAPPGCRKRSRSLRGRWGCGSSSKPFRLCGGGPNAWENGSVSVTGFAEGAFEVLAADSGHRRWRCFTPVSSVDSAIGIIGGDGWRRRM